MIIIHKLKKKLKIAQKGTLINTGARSLALYGQHFLNYLRLNDSSKQIYPKHWKKKECITTNSCKSDITAKRKKKVWKALEK